MTPTAYITWPVEAARHQQSDTDDGSTAKDFEGDYVNVEALAVSDLTDIGMTNDEATAFIAALAVDVAPEYGDADLIRHELFEQRRPRDLPDPAPTRWLVRSSAAIRVLARLGSHGFRLLRLGVEPTPLSRTMTSSDIWNTTSDVERFFAGIQPKPPVDDDAISYERPEGAGGEPR